MKIIICKDYEHMSRFSADIVIEQIRQKLDSVIGLATGSTPLGMYKELIRQYKKGRVDFSKVVTFNLDEYLGLSPDHPQSYHYFMFNNFFNHINIKIENVNLPGGITAYNLDGVCREYDEKIEKAGGIDLQILGIGHNGHIGFNEPGKKLYTQTHIVSLSHETIKANSRFFDHIDEVPRKAITMGVGGIMRAKKILLLASGKDKAAIIKKAFSGIITTEIPASLLQLHKDILVILDKEAAKELKLDNKRFCA